jgi:LAS superfamily LD-carboxypeptidase LdcB
MTGCGTTKKEEKEKIDYLVLVNKQNKLPDNWEEIVELSDAKDFEGGTIQVEKEALEKFYELRNDLLEEGVDIELDSAYRSVKRQKELWAEFEKEYGLEYTKKTVATPGYSEHHTGLAIDVCIRKNGKLIYENADMVKEKKIFAKVHAKLAEYGFILRYPEGKDDITGYSYEPWHFRYIKDTKKAQEIMSKGLTLEEYLKDNNKK